ncbi:MAG: hydroxymethylbilane synthase [Longimicrobiales bacterium]
MNAPERSGASGGGLRIGTRSSTLALWQAEQVRARLLDLDPHRSIEVQIVRTTGDQISDKALSQIGDRGIFTKELDRALLEQQVDLAVHSLKDLPTEITEGICVSAVLERIDPRDALVVAPGRPRRLHELPAGARIGTSSLRRRAQLLARRADLVIEDMRGNLDTRLARIADGVYDAAVLAWAGIARLGRQDSVAEILEVPAWLPAAGQGALAVTTRCHDAGVIGAVQPLDHAQTRAATTAERAFLGTLHGGCQVPIGVLGMVAAELDLHGVVASLDGERVVRGHLRGPLSQPADLGRQLAEQLLARGAGDILNEIRAQQLPRPAAP